MTKQTSGPRLGKLDLTRRSLLAGGATVVLAPTYWKQASAQEKRIFIRDPGGPMPPASKKRFTTRSLRQRASRRLGYRVSTSQQASSRAWSIPKLILGTWV